MTTSDAWKILKGECTLPEAMKILGRTDDEIKEKMDYLNSRKNAHVYDVLSILYFELCYDFLVKEKEIDGTKFFNMAAQGDGFNN